MSNRKQSKATVRGAIREVRKISEKNHGSMDKFLKVQERESSVRALKNLIGHLPWLWGITGRWFMRNDCVEIQILTTERLRCLPFTRITDAGGSSWFIYQQLRNDREQVECVGTHDTRSGTAIARVIRNCPGVAFLVELKWVGRGKRMQRQITLYEVPCNSRGSTLKAMCETALLPLVVNKQGRIVANRRRE